PGYPESIATGENRIRNPEIARLYDRVRSVTEGPLWSGPRWASIVYLNLFYRRPVCEEPPCRNLRARLLDPSVREPLFDIGDGAVEEIAVRPAEGVDAEGAASSGPVELMLSGWLPDVEADVLWLSGTPIKAPALRNAAHPDIYRRSEGRVGLMAGFVIRADFESLDDARAAADTSCLLVREKPRGRPGEWHSVPRLDGGCAELVRRDSQP
ncbi:MAG: hypothetical protein AAGF23_27465, partial [Acidobacteriota bacterium]